MRPRYRNAGNASKVCSLNKIKTNRSHLEYKFEEMQRNFTQTLVDSIPYFKTISKLKISYTQKYSTDKGVPSICLVINQADLAQTQKALQAKNIYPKKKLEDKLNGLVLLVLKDDYETLQKKLTFNNSEKKETAPSPNMSYLKEQNPQILSTMTENEVFKTIRDYEICCKTLEEKEAIIKQWKEFAEIKNEPTILFFHVHESTKKIDEGLMLRFNDKKDCQNAFNFIKRNNIKAELLSDALCPFDDNKLDMIRLDGIKDIASLMELLKRCNVQMINQHEQGSTQIELNAKSDFKP